MADDTLAAGATAQASAPRVLFERFKWHDLDRSKAEFPVGSVADFTARVQDVAHGVQAVLQMAERDELEVDEDAPAPLFNAYTRGVLQRFCITALELLHDDAQSMAEALQATAEEFERTKGGAA